MDNNIDFKFHLLQALYVLEELAKSYQEDMKNHYLSMYGQSENNVEVIHPAMVSRYDRDISECIEALEFSKKLRAVCNASKN